MCLLGEADTIKVISLGGIDDFLFLKEKNAFIRSSVICHRTFNMDIPKLNNWGIFYLKNKPRIDRLPC